MLTVVVPSRLASNVGLDLPGVASWCEKALPFLLLLFCTFIYRHIQGEPGLHTVSSPMPAELYHDNRFLGFLSSALLLLQGLRCSFASQ